MLRASTCRAKRIAHALFESLPPSGLIGAHADSCVCAHQVGSDGVLDVPMADETVWTAAGAFLDPLYREYEANPKDFVLS